MKPRGELIATYKHKTRDYLLNKIETLLEENARLKKESQREEIEERVKTEIALLKSDKNLRRSYDKVAGLKRKAEAVSRGSCQVQGG